MKKLLGLLIVIFLSFWLIRPLLSNGYFPMHDDTQVARVVVMGKALREGQFPVRWVSDLGYGFGYPIFNFYGPLPYYIGGGLYALGVDSVVATKLMFGIGIILASVTIYLLLEKVFGKISAIVGSIAFSYAPYHAVDIYVRGAVGEYWAIAFLPLLVLGFVLLSKKKQRLLGILVGAIGLFGVIFSHTILGYLTTGIVVVSILIFLGIRVVQKKMNIVNILMPVSILVLGLSLSAFFWIPAFSEMKYTGVSSMITGATTGFFDHFVCVGQLWNSPWGFGGSAPGCIDGMSFKLGKPEIILAILGIGGWLFLLFKKKQSKAIIFMDGSVALFIVSLVGVLSISQSIWSMIPFYSFIQYPWRLLSYTIVCLGCLGAFFVTLIQRPVFRLVFALIAIGLCIGVNAKLFQPHYLYARDSSEFETPTELRYRISKISDEYLPAGIPKPSRPEDIVHGLVKGDSINVTILKDTDTSVEVEVESSKIQQIQIQKAYFPGWKYQINGKDVIPKIARGLPSMIVSEGKSLVEMRFTNTPIRTVGNVISVISILLMAGILIYDKKTNS